MVNNKCGKLSKNGAFGQGAKKQTGHGARTRPEGLERGGKPEGDLSSAEAGDATTDRKSAGYDERSACRTLRSLPPL